MLTKEEIELFPERIHLPIPTGSCRSRQLKDQAIAAIDLAAENERLKAKLDAVLAECVKTIEFNGEVGEATEARYILAIIDKDGE